MRALGPFVLLDELAKGGMGEVWLAQKIGLDDVVVIKTVRTDKGAADDPMLRRRFLDEMRTALLLVHPCIVRTIDAGSFEEDTLGATDYIALEVVEGVNLGVLIQRHILAGARIPETAALFVMAAALDGLAFAHGARHPLTDEPLQVVHRDISPQNIMTAADGTVKVIDFGVALSALKQSRTATGLIPGKLSYMAPEQAAGQQVDQRVDVFSCAMTLYEALVQVRYYGNVSLQEVVRLIAAGFVPPQMDRLPADVQRVLRAALATDRDARTPTAGALRDQVLELLDVRGGLPVGAQALAECVQRFAGDEMARIARARELARTPREQLVGQVIAGLDDPTTMSMAVSEARAVEAAVKRMHETSSGGVLARALESPATIAPKTVRDVAPQRAEPDTVQIVKRAPDAPPAADNTRTVSLPGMRAVTRPTAPGKTVPLPAPSATRRSSAAVAVGAIAGVAVVVAALVGIIGVPRLAAPRAPVAVDAGVVVTPAPPVAPTPVTPPPVPTPLPPPVPPPVPTPLLPPSTTPVKASIDPLCARFDVLRACSASCARAWTGSTCSSIQRLSEKQRASVERSLTRCEAACR